MRQLALGDGASQCFGHFFLGREVIYRCGAVLLDPELRAAHFGACPGSSSAGPWWPEMLQRALVIGRMLVCEDRRCTSGPLQAPKNQLRGSTFEQLVGQYAS